MNKRKNLPAITHKKRGFWKEIRLAAISAWEYLRASVRYRKISPAVTVFGSARFKPEHPYCQLAEAVGAKLAEAGYTCITGGGPGIMAAAHRGGANAGGLCAGANIVIPLEEEPSPHMHISYQFSYFFIRKVMLAKYSRGFIILPGGFGTMDELFEVATLMQTGRMPKHPIVLIGKSFWQPLLDFLQNIMVSAQTISPEDMDFFSITDNADDAVNIINDFNQSNP